MILATILLLLAIIGNFILISVGVSSIIIKKNTPKGFLKTNYQIEMAILSNKNEIQFWVRIVIVLEFIITLLIIDHVIN